VRRLAVLVLAAALPGCARLSAPESTLFSVEDPRGDDHGDGQLSYPIREDLRDGDLDLVRFTVRPDAEGTVFEATFARPIARPDPRALDLAGTSLTSIAKLGFYTFNLDVYLDTDRVEGSGHRALLPGRLAEVTASGAWEKAICLTPRPLEARDELRRIWIAERTRELAAKSTVDPSTAAAVEREVDRRIQSEVYFPNRVRVAGPTVRFTVPRGVLGGEASPSWGYLVAVSLADLEPKQTLTSLLGLKGQDTSGVMITGIAPIATREKLGGGRAADPWQPPLLDIIVGPGQRQEEILVGSFRQVGERVQIPPFVPSGQPPRQLDGEGGPPPDLTVHPDGAPEG
jgi:hypothetical protein